MMTNTAPIGQRHGSEVSQTGWPSRRRLSLSGRVGLWLVGGFVTAGGVAWWVAPLRPSEGLLADPYQQSDTVRPRPPSWANPLGTDSLGRDMLSRTLHGARLSLTAGVGAMTLALFLGGGLGLIAGWVGGRFDSTVMRGVDVLLAFPGLLLAIAVVAALEDRLRLTLEATLGPSAAESAGLAALILAVALLNIGPLARQTRAAVIEVRQRLYMEAATALGATQTRLLTRHVLPNVAGTLSVMATLGVGLAILEAAGLSFLGLGLEPDSPEWGRMLADSRAFLTTEPWVALAPGVAISLTVLGFNLLGDALRDWLDVRA